MGSIPAAVLTLIWLHTSGMQQSHNQLMFKTLGATLILSSFAAVFRKRFHAFGARMRGARPIEFKSLQPALTVLAGAILGFLVTFTSIGAGALGTAASAYRAAEGRGAPRSRSAKRAVSVRKAP